MCIFLMPSIRMYVNKMRRLETALEINRFHSTQNKWINSPNILAKQFSLNVQVRILFHLNCFGGEKKKRRSISDLFHLNGIRSIHVWIRAFCAIRISSTISWLSLRDHPRYRCPIATKHIYFNRATKKIVAFEWHLIFLLST